MVLSELSLLVPCNALHGHLYLPWSIPHWSVRTWKFRVYFDGPQQLQCLVHHLAVVSCVTHRVFLETQLFSNCSPLLASWLKQLPSLCSLPLPLLQVRVCFLPSGLNLVDFADRDVVR